MSQWRHSASEILVNIGLDIPDGTKPLQQMLSFNCETYTMGRTSLKFKSNTIILFRAKACENVVYRMSAIWFFGSFYQHGLT